MSKKKGKDKAKLENKPNYFDFTTLRIRSLQLIICSTMLTSCGAYAPFTFLVSICRIRGGFLKNDASPSGLGHWFRKLGSLKIL